MITYLKPYTQIFSAKNDTTGTASNNTSMAGKPTANGTAVLGAAVGNSTDMSGIKGKKIKVVKIAKKSKTGPGGTVSNSTATAIGPAKNISAGQKTNGTKSSSGSSSNATRNPAEADGTTTVKSKGGKKSTSDSGSTTTNGTATKGTKTKGTATKGAATKGTATKGTATKGNATKGTAKNGSAKNGSATNGTASTNGTVGRTAPRYFKPAFTYPPGKKKFLPLRLAGP